MNADERHMLEEILKITEQNNRILRRMRREVVLGRLFHILYWAIIIAVAVASYYYIKPYLGSLDGALQTVDKFKDIQMPR